MSRAQGYRESKAQIALEAISVPVETTVKIRCPMCDGGPDHQSCMAVTRAHNGAMFLCHRASCGFRGFVAIGQYGTKDEAQKSKRKPARPYLGVHNTHYSCLANWRYPGFMGAAQEPFIMGLSFESDKKAQVYECRGFQGELLGHVTRSPDKTIKTFRFREGVDMYSVYYGNRESRRFVLVEDCISAMCVASHGYNSVALLGTNVPPAVRAAMRWYDQCAVFLDPDAEAKALQIAESLGGIAIIGQRADPKDLPNLGDILREHM